MFISNKLLRTGWFNAWRRMEYGTLQFTSPEGETFTFDGPNTGPHRHAGAA